jgi:hypothetical protein
VLEWVYGSIVSTAEKSRDGAKRCLGLTPPTTQQAYDNLVRCLEDQAAWEGRAKEVSLLQAYGCKHLGAVSALNNAAGTCISRCRYCVLVSSMCLCVVELSRLPLTCFQSS